MFKAYKQYQERVESFLNFVFDKKLPAHSLSFSDLNASLIEAMRYSVLNGGKRIRPTLVYIFGEALKLRPQILDGAAAAVELIHCYSLIHDDLPAMDDDDLRRGKPSCHRAFDEATAILAGDALQALSFEVLSDPELNPVSSEKQIKMIQILSQAIGALEMVGGQALDMAAEVELLQEGVKSGLWTFSVQSPDLTPSRQTISLESLKAIHSKKTAALIEASILFPAVLSDLPPKTFPLFKSFAQNLGLAFQVRDDILDLEAEISDLGKTPLNDLRNNKATFVSLMGLDSAKAYSLKLIEEANLSLEKLKNSLSLSEASTQKLAQLTEFMIQRKA